MTRPPGGRPLTVLFAPDSFKGSLTSVEVARALGRNHPEAFVFLGGVTAAYFGAEILAAFPEIHGILPGHGEGPLLDLLLELPGGSALLLLNEGVRIADSGRCGGA